MSSRVNRDNGGAKPWNGTSPRSIFFHLQNLEVTLGKKRRRIEASIADAEVLLASSSVSSQSLAPPLDPLASPLPSIIPGSPIIGLSPL